MYKITNFQLKTISNRVTINTIVGIHVSKIYFFLYWNFIIEMQMCKSLQIMNS